MNTTVIIPVWNGASVIGACLDTLTAQRDEMFHEIICVDNASQDESATLIAQRHPIVRLLRQPVNLGFAGGVKAGIAAAQGDLLVLLNQDCMVQAGWLSALRCALDKNPESGIAGCTILNVDGTLNHAGAYIRRPDAYGVHVTDKADEPHPVEYVTGAAFAIRRRAWDTVGRFDEGFYPGYFEESDYCFRARRKGLQTLYVPEARVVHLLSGTAWLKDPVKHTSNQHLARYRFVSKHFSSDELLLFFDAEQQAVSVERYFDQVLARILASRSVLRALDEIAIRRQIDLNDPPSATLMRLLRVGFTEVLRQAFVGAQSMQTLPKPMQDLTAAAPQLGPTHEYLQAAREWENAASAQIFDWLKEDARNPVGTRERLHSLFNRMMIRLTGRNPRHLHDLLYELCVAQSGRLNNLEAANDQREAALKRRLAILEMLFSYDNS